MLLVIVMMLTIALIAFTSMAPNEVTEIKRDREEELIHRGKAYARGIKLFYKRFGRYPTSLNELQGTQNIKFIRQLYKDPMSPDGEWRLIHIGEAKYPPKGFGFSNIPGAQSIGTPIGGGMAGTQTTGGAIMPGGVGSILGGSSAGAPSSQLGSNPPSTGGMTPAEQMSKPIGGSAQNMMPVMGVASTNKSTSIHEVNERKKYNEWEFIYDPRYDIAAQMPQVIPGGVGGTMPGALNQQVAPGTQPGSQQSPFSNTFGQPGTSPQPQPTPQPAPNPRP